MKRSVVETVLGGVVIVAAGMFLSYGYKKADIGSANGYEVTADFTSTGGLKAGDRVQISGVKVGVVKNVELLPESYLARVHLDIDPAYKLPADTAAMISSESLLGGLYMSLEPGADERLIEPGGRIQYTQAPQNLEQLLGKFIFSLQDEKKSNTPSGDPAIE
ncbi:MAG: outer membrane lipid asymmetry maintenance protein MlaD [Alphaproteobacteria bacterium]|nr:outer membrane lipid asymmetry maintenance protein MlaD [Alphaproteobacteria bacterium]MCB1839575.1 outer membrane lipid asymmetry maintenance protein MlaD [Alphaproteobacteria bacterium]